MLNESTYETLKQMKFSAMSGELKCQLQDPSTYNQLSFEERLGLLINAE